MVVSVLRIALVVNRTCGAFVGHKPVVGNVVHAVSVDMV